MAENARQSNGIIALLKCNSIEQASKESGISSRTFRRWLSQDSFKLEIERQKRSLVESAVNSLRLASRGAVEVLNEIAQDKNQNAAARVSASRALVSLTLESAAISDIEARLSLLETKNHADWKPSNVEV